MKTAFLVCEVLCPGCGRPLSTIADPELGAALQCQNSFQECKHYGILYGAPTVELLTKEEALRGYRIVQTNGAK